MEFDRVCKVERITEWMNFTIGDYCSFNGNDDFVAILHIKDICKVVDNKIIIDDIDFRNKIEKSNMDNYFIDQYFLLYEKYYIGLDDGLKFIEFGPCYSLAEWAIKELLE